MTGGYLDGISLTQTFKSGIRKKTELQGFGGIFE